MATATNEYRPDYVVPPGWVLEERLAAYGISHAEFARRCGRSSKLISEIIAGKAALEPETALQFEKVLGVDASIWLGIETDYQLHQARETELADASAFLEWFKSFPIQDLVARKAIAKPESPVDAASKLLSFFRVASVDAWKMKYGSANVAYRHSASFHSDERALATWLRLGEIEAEQQKAVEFNEAKFKHALRELRLLTRVPVGEALVRAKQLCNQAGVALALIKPLPKTALSGAAWWRSPKEAVIQLSARHKTDDHLWFSLFHEAAHILLHSKKSVFVDETAGDGADYEREADAWASNMLVAQPRWERFIATCPRSEQHIRGFANEQGIAPGIVVGMLQHHGVLPWTHLNGLKKKLVWSDPS